MSWKPALTEKEKKASRRGSLSPDLAKAQIQLDKLPPWSVILDGRGHAWQVDLHGYWYRSFGDDSLISPFELTQIIRGEFTVLHPEPAS